MGMTSNHSSAPKRHHYVPECYLKAWAINNEIAVRRRDAKRPFVTGPSVVATEIGLYGDGVIASAREKMFGRLEEDWPRLREKVITSESLSSDERHQVSLFMALQIVRTREHLAQQEFVTAIAKFSDERPLSRDTVRRFLTERHLGFPPEDSEVEGAWTLASYVLGHGQAPTRDESLQTGIQIALEQLGPRLGRMSWTLECCRKSILITSDRPVMFWRSKSVRDQIEGIGLEGAEEIRFPLDPGNMLVLRHAAANGVKREKVEPKRFVQVNSDVASQCFEFIVGRPTQARKLGELRLASKRPSLRFNVGPGIRKLPDGREEPMGDVLHMWIPTHQTDR
jgi:hypothetical protein